jgi:hypothetical protein
MINYIKKVLWLITILPNFVYAMTLDLEVDPIFYAIDGSSVHFGISSQNHRVELGAFQLKGADSEIHENDNFDLKLEGIGIKYDYLFGQYEGLYMGWELHLAETEYTHTPSNEIFKRHVTTTAPRIGYRFTYLNCLTVSTSLAYDILLDEGDDVFVGQDQYKNKNGGFVPTVHIGFYF